MVGWFASRGINLFCDGDGLIITGSRAMMVEFILKHGEDPDDFEIRSTTASEILAGIAAGGVYCLEQQAYQRFLGPARAAGLPLEKHSFGDFGDVGVELARVGGI